MLIVIIEKYQVELRILNISLPRFPIVNHLVSTFRIRFTVVSEPPDDDDEGECEDIGIAFVSVRDILINKYDVIDQDIPSKSLNVLMSRL